MNRHVRQMALLCFFGFALGTISAWIEVNRMADRVALIEPAAGTSLAGAAIGGSFSLINQDGAPVTEQTYAGAYQLVFFGFTNCPEICPAGLGKMTAALDSLGKEAEGIQPLFITVDPQRDTPEVMKEYVAQFHPRLAGLTGSDEQIGAVQSAYKVYAAKVDGATAGSYSMDHSAYTFFMSPDGQPLTMFSSEGTPDAMAKEMRQILRQDQAL